MKNVLLYSAIATLEFLTPQQATAQPELETGSQKPMPAAWIDKDTHHKVVRLTNLPGSSSSFYFHNNPFIAGGKGAGDRMIFYNTSDDSKQVYTVDLHSLATEKITSQYAKMNGEIVGAKKHDVYYQVKDSVFVTNADTKATKLVFVFPEGFKGSISTLNADETMLAGGKADDAQKEILAKYPAKSEFFNRVYNAHLPNDLFTINISTGELKKIHTENTWLGHVQFSPTDPDMLSFCHEGPWEKVDRMWMINVKTKALKLMHKRTMDMEIAGHEFFAPDGKAMWFDLQLPKGASFFLARADLYSAQSSSANGAEGTLKETKYEMTRDEWSIHFNVSKDEKTFCGDGGNDTQVAKAKDGMWIYKFKPEGSRLKSERLVNMKYHGYKLEPNVHFSPDEKWVIFRANFEGTEQVYAVEL